MSTKRKPSLILTDLPSEVLIEIISRLPLRTLFVARSVCKTFLSLTQSSNATAQILVFQYPSSLLRFADLDCENSQLNPLFQLPKTDLNLLYLVNSCNGLLYFLQNRPLNRAYPSLVCNPVTSEYIIIPGADSKTRLSSMTKCSWLGFSPATNQYKVLRIFFWNNTSPHELAAQVFVIGSDSWRDIDDTPPHRPYFYYSLCPALVNGLMYWFNHLWPDVVSFDFEREKFGEVALPPGFIANDYTSIGVLGGSLCLSYNDYEAHRVDLWVMRKCGSWRKEFVVDTGGLQSGLVRFQLGCGLIHFQFKPLQFLQNGEILMLWSDEILVCYDPRTKSLRHFKLHGMELNRNFVALTPNFVSLKDTLRIENVLRPSGDEEEL